VTAAFGPPGGVAGTPVLDDGGAPARAVFQFAAGEVAPARSGFTLAPDGVVANGVATHTIEVILRDAQGHPVTGPTDDLTASAGEVQVSGWTSLGSGRYAGLVTSTRAGQIPVEVAWAGQAVGPDTPGGQTWLLFTPGPPSPASGLELDPAGVVGAGTVVTATATLVDAFGNPISGTRVRLDVPGADGDGAILTTGEGTGLAIFQFTPHAARDYQVTAVAVDPASGQIGAAQTVTVVAGPFDPNAPTTGLSVSPGTRPTGPDRPHTVTTTATDTWGNPVENVAVQFLIEGAATPAAGSALTGATDADGVYSADLVAATPGISFVTVSLGGVTLPGRVEAEFVTGSVDPARSSFAVDAGPVTADGTAAAEVIVTLRDAQGNLVDGEIDSVHGELAGSGGVGTGGLADWRITGTGQYTGRATSTVAGTRTVTVYWAGQAIGSGPATIDFTAGPVAAGSTFAVSQDAATANGAPGQTVTLTLVDAHGNPVTDSQDRKSVV
jgi:adhesin/invasin